LAASCRRFRHLQPGGWGRTSRFRPEPAAPSRAVNSRKALRGCRWRSPAAWAWVDRSVSRYDPPTASGTAAPRPGTGGHPSWLGGLAIQPQASGSFAEKPQHQPVARAQPQALRPSVLLARSTGTPATTCGRASASWALQTVRGLAIVLEAESQPVVALPRHGRAAGSRPLAQREAASTRASTRGRGHRRLGARAGARHAHAPAFLAAISTSPLKHSAAIVHLKAHRLSTSAAGQPGTSSIRVGRPLTVLIHHPRQAAGPGRGGRSAGA